MSKKDLNLYIEIINKNESELHNDEGIDKVAELTGIAREKLYDKSN